MSTHTNHCFAATIGFFDGVHSGHRFLIDCLKREARQRGLQSMVVTFAEHPRHVLCPDWQPQLLSTPEEKEALLRQTGIDRLVFLPFDAAMSRLTARQFMEQVLRNQLGVRLLLTGYDNHFGHRVRSEERGVRSEEGFDDYVGYGRELGIEVIGGTPLTEGNMRFSSSLARRLLSEGHVSAASTCLGRPYSLSGRVVHGQQIGRQIGFPTANIEVGHPFKLIPRHGVYAVRVMLSERRGDVLSGVRGDVLSGVRGTGVRGCEDSLAGMMNIGKRPTFDGHQTTLETHILGFDGDLYGQHISVEFIERLRDERPFPDADALVRQMQHDARRAATILSLK